MKAAKTNLADRLQSAAPAAANTVAHGVAGQDGFLSQMKGELSMSDALAHLATLDAAGKKKNGLASAGVITEGKSKSKQASKTANDTGLVSDAKTVPSVDPLTAAMQVAIQPAAGPVVDAGNAQKKSGEVAPVAIKSTSLVAQQIPQPDAAANGAAEIAAAKPMDLMPALEVKTKRAVGPVIVASGEKSTAGAVGADGLPLGMGANGMAVGGVGGQGMLGGQSSGSSAHHGQGTPSHPGGGTAPQIVASSPSQLDVGVFDDTHGWLRIRAELGAGGAVNATLTAANAAHESLRTALPEMTHYLGTESVHVNSIELHRFGDGPGGQAGSHADGQQQGSAAGQHTGGDEQQQAAAQANVMAAMDEVTSGRVDVAAEVGGGAEVEAVAGTTAVSAVSAPEAVSDSGAVSDIATVTRGLDGVDMSGVQVLPWQVGYGGSGGWVNVSA